MKESEKIMEKGLSDKTRKRLIKNGLPESALPEVEEACALYFLIKEATAEATTRKEDQEWLKELKTAVEKVKTAQAELAKLIEEMPLWPQVHIRIALKRLHRGLMDPSFSMVSTAACTPSTEGLERALATVKIPRRRKDLAARALVRLLIDIWLDHKGEMPGRNYNTTLEQEYGPIHAIVGALAPELGCGSLAGIIKEQLKQGKE